MIDALHNLALRARQCRVFSFSITLHDNGITHVIASCRTDDDALELAAMLRLDGIHQSQPTETVGNERNTWLHATFQLGMTEVRVMGPLHAVTQEAA